jgi:hypothetical protein
MFTRWIQAIGLSLRDRDEDSAWIRSRINWESSISAAAQNSRALEALILAGRRHRGDESRRRHLSPQDGPARQPLLFKTHLHISYRPLRISPMMSFPGFQAKCSE